MSDSKNGTPTSQWWSSLREHLLKYAEKLLGDHNAAEDLVQQVALAILLYEKPFINEEHFRRWSFQKLKWFALDFFKKREREGSIFVREKDLDILSSQFNEQKTEEAISTLREKISELSKRQKEVATFYYIQYQDISTIASSLQIKESTVRSLLRHARSALVESMKREFDQ